MKIDTLKIDWSLHILKILSKNKYILLIYNIKKIIDEL
jgi:hypothetical protein